MLGVVVTALFGFSFTALRLSTLILSLVNVLGVYWVARELNSQRKYAVAVALTLAFNPIYFSLSHTFMTDIPFLVFLTLAFLFFVRCLKNNTVVSLILGTCLSTVAILCRQTGLFIPIAFGLTYLVKHKISPRSTLWACLPLVIGVCALIGFQKWLEVTGKLPLLYGVQIKELVDGLHDPIHMLKSFPKNLFFATQYLGLFLSPVLLLFTMDRIDGKRSNKVLQGMLLLYILGSIVLTLFRGRLMPLLQKTATGGSILVREGIGPLTLHDVYVLNLSNVPALSDVFWAAVTLLSTLGGGILLVCLASVIISMASDIRSVPKQGQRIHMLFFLLSAVIYFSPLSISQLYFDRYLIPLLLPLSFLIILSRTERIISGRKTIKALAVFLIACFVFFSTTVTHDYIAWNRTRWEALHDVMTEDGASPSQIDGGFEFNGLYLYSNDYQPNYPKSWWWVQDDLYMISFGEVPGYKVLQQYRYNRWLPRNEGKILVLKREEKSVSKREGSNAGR